MSFQSMFRPRTPRVRQNLPAIRTATALPASASRACLEPLESRQMLSGDPEALFAAAAPASAAGPVFGGPDDYALTASARSNTISDPRGDFLPTYTGPHDAGLDVVAHQVTLSGDRVIFFGQMAGPVAPTQEIGGIYLFGVDRGRGTPRFRAGTPLIGPNVTWDLIVRINPNGTGLVNNQIAGVTTQLDPADIRIDGNTITASVPLSLLLPGATRPPEQWTYNLWPRNGIVPGQNVHVSDLAPDDGNSPVQVLSRNGSPGFGQFGPPDAAPQAHVPGAAVASNAFPHTASITDDVLGTADERSLLA